MWLGMKIFHSRNVKISLKVFRSKIGIYLPVIRDVFMVTSLIKNLTPRTEYYIASQTGKSLYPLTPMSDQDRISPYHINTISTR